MKYLSLEGLTEVVNNIKNLINTSATNTLTNSKKYTDGKVDTINSTMSTKASVSALDTHTSNTTSHITSTERTNWGAAYTHSQATHAPSNAQANQNAFSNVKVGSTTVVADTTTDTIELVGSNITITPDATNDKVTFAVADGSTSAKGLVQLTNSTSSTSTTTAATPSSVKSAYDLANTAKTNAATAQSTADSAVNKFNNLTSENIKNIFVADGDVIQMGYVGFAQLKIESSYVNRPIEFELICRGRETPCYVSVQFNNGDTTDPDLKSLRYCGCDYGIFIQKTDVSTWVLYYAKTEAYDSVTIADIKKATQGIAITYPNIFASTKPTENVTDATIGGSVKYASILSSVLPIDKGGTGATTAKVAEFNLLNGVVEVMDAIEDNTMLTMKYQTPDTSRGVLYSRKASLLWDYIKGKADNIYAKVSHGNHVPTTEAANNAKFLRNDNTWQTVTPANIGAATSDHTHNYAGSSSASGAATSANKINTDAGDSNTPVYFSNGIPVVCTSLDLNTSGSSATCTGNSATASKLANARKINLSGDMAGDVSFDGNADVTLNAYNYNCIVSKGNTNNFPYCRIAHVEGTGSHQENNITLYVTQGTNAKFGVLRIAARSQDQAATTSGYNYLTIDAKWLCRSGFNNTDFIIGIINTSGAWAADIFYKCDSSYASLRVKQLDSGNKDTFKRTWTLINSKEPNNTTTQSACTECYANVSDYKTYSSTVNPTDGMTVNYANNSDSVDGFGVSGSTGNYLRPINYGTSSLTAGTSALNTGYIYLQYE